MKHKELMTKCITDIRMKDELTDRQMVTEYINNCTDPVAKQHVQRVVIATETCLT